MTEAEARKRLDAYFETHDGYRDREDLFAVLDPEEDLSYAEAWALVDAYLARRRDEAEEAFADDCAARQWASHD